MKSFFSLAAEQKIAAEPLDWFRNVTPSLWRFDGKEQQFDLSEDEGTTADFLNNARFLDVK
jgi:hypothetical protein